MDLWKKRFSRLVDLALILALIYLSFRLLQKQGIIETKIENLDRIPNFKVEDFNGQLVTNKYFEDYEYTIINIWSPFCSLCTEEMEALKELESYIEETGGGILGIGINSPRPMMEKAVEDRELSWTNISPNMKMKKDFMASAVATPTTIFVDSKGRVLEFSAGGYGKEGDLRYIKSVIERIVN